MKWILTLLLSFTLSWASAQVLTQVYVDPCSGKVLTVTVPIANGTVTVVYRGQYKVVTANDITSGALTAWITSINALPCEQQVTTVVVTQAVTQAVAQATQQATAQATAQATQAATSAATSSTTSAATSSAASAATSSAAASTPPPAASTSSPSTSSSSSSSSSSESSSKSETKSESSSESKSESKSEEKSESKSESKSEKKSEDKKSSKSSTKSAARVNPIVYSSDLTIIPDASFNIGAIISLGMSQTSVMGNASYGLTSMIWSTFDQFALSGRYTRMHTKNGNLTHISNYGLTAAYIGGGVVSFATAAAIVPLGKYGVTGANYALSYANDTWSNGLLLFYTKPVSVSKRLTISPDIYLSNSLTKDLGIMTGANFDIALTKRFKFNCGLKTTLSTNPDVPQGYMAMIGTKINL